MTAQPRPPPSQPFITSATKALDRAPGLYTKVNFVVFFTLYFLGFLAHALAADIRALIAQLRRRLREEAPPHGLTPSEQAVIVRLDSQGPLTLTALALAEGMRSQSVGATVATLKASGLVAGTPDPADGRQTLLSLTETCRDLIQANRAARDDWLSQAIATRFTPQDQRTVAAGVDLLKRLLD